jgi:Ca2+-binding EF-hand superfamily protein
MRKTLAIFCLGSLAAFVPLLSHAQDAKGGGMRDPEKMRQAFDQRFKKADANGDGKLTKAEADAGMPRIAKNFDTIDANKDGFITPDEIRATMEKRQAAKGESTK